MTSVEESMKSISSKVMLLSTSFLFRFEAAYALSSNEPYLAFDRHGTHTHYTQILAPVPHLSSAHNEMEYKLASVCFVTDTTDCRGGNYDIPDYNICVEDGYDKTSCPDEFYIPENYCPYDSKYFANCRDACEGYVECVDPYYGVGEACRGLYEKCECDTCPGYVFESDIPRGYHKVGEACNSCDGPKYKYEINTCDGFMECTDTGPEDGAEVCWRGDTPTYSSCKPCANLGDLDSCPAHYVCKYEDCSKKYYKTGCEDGYIWDEAAKTCTPECDPNDRTCQCPGKHFCDPDTKVGDGKTCTTADGTTYYERCLVKETCITHHMAKDPVYPQCHIRNSLGLNNYSYFVEKYCTTQQNQTYYRFCSCTATQTDPLGNMPPCAGKKQCDNDSGYGEPCICGNGKYFDKCDECQIQGQRWEKDENGNGGWCTDTTTDVRNPDYDGGMFYVDEKCKMLDGTPIYVIGYCGQSGCRGYANSCNGKMLCEDDEGAEGEVACECGGRKYFNKCKEMCQYKVNNAGVKFHETSHWFTKGWYMDKVVCTRLDGSKVGYRKQCNATTTDAAGNMPPCAGMKECPNGTFGTGEKCSCGGVLFYSGNCITECTYEDTAESCAAKGQSFEQKCYGTKDEQQTWFGQCK